MVHTLEPFKVSTMSSGSALTSSTSEGSLFDSASAFAGAFVAVALPLPLPRSFLVGAAASAEGESWCFEAPAVDVSGILAVGVVIERMDGEDG
jgi:hypothetical protein